MTRCGVNAFVQEGRSGCKLPGMSWGNGRQGGERVGGVSTRALRCLCCPHQDGSGYIDENELDALLKDLYEKNKKVSS